MFQDLCRLCARESVKDKKLKLFERKHRTLLTQLKAVTGVMLRNNPGLPNFVCTSCIKSLKAAHQFRETVLKAQIVFKTKPAKVVAKIQLPIEATEFVQVCFLKNEKDQNNIELPNIGEKENSEEKTVANESYTTEINRLDISSNDEMAHKIEEQDENDIVDSNYIRYEDVDQLSDEFTTQDDGIEAEYDSCSQNNPKKSKRKLNSKKKTNSDTDSNPSENKVRKRRKNLETRPVAFICDQCGNHFTCRHHFKMHLRRHTGDKQCACELCPDKFFTSSELKRHMRKHTGERPFACKFCERRFTDYSTRIKHERTHTNERPFTCSQCGKSFTTSYILKNHMLTHTGERHFKCDVCVKAFTRRTHLVVHFRSIMHKQAVEKEKKLNSEDHQI